MREAGGERRGRHIPFAPLAGRRCRQADEGRPRAPEDVKCLLSLAAYVAAKPARSIVGRKIQGDDTWTLPLPRRSPSSSSAPRET
ncbi:hypothetical protein ELH84_05205 [Rhizobium ruizarguesonis]|nr:hypothetical protein ELH84_05205 [Rhizobium ruizarguesonis]